MMVPSNAEVKTPFSEGVLTLAPHGIKLIFSKKIDNKFIYNK